MEDYSYKKFKYDYKLADDGDIIEMVYLQNHQTNTYDLIKERRIQDRQKNKIDTDPLGSARLKYFDRNLTRKENLALNGIYE